MRIIAGNYKGTKLVSPKSDKIRPTTDRVRESIFNILEHGKYAFSLEQIRVLDLFAGTGALGLEAMSRGAAFCLFVEDNTAARAIIRRNIEIMSLTGSTKVFRRDATKLSASGRHGQFDLVFLDPPYGQDLGERAIRSLQEGGWLSPAARIVLEESHKIELDLPDTLKILDNRSYGDTRITMIQPV